MSRIVFADLGGLGGVPQEVPEVVAVVAARGEVDDANVGQQRARSAAHCWAASRPGGSQSGMTTTGERPAAMRSAHS